MKLLTAIRSAFLAALLLLAPIPALAAQAPYAQPTTGPHSMADFVTNYLNPTMGAILSLNSGTSAPSVTGQPAAFQFWVDTSTTPRVLKVYDGTSWLAIGTIDTSGHIWIETPASLKMPGSSSGTTTVSPQAAAGTPTLLWPTTSGTLPSSATSPIAINGTTGVVSCPTCATSSGGGAVTGTAPIAVSGAGVVSVTGAAGQVLAGATPAFTAAPVLGVNTSAAGSVGLANGGASGATVTVQNPSATTAYNYNLPATPGASGQLMQSAAGGSSPMTWWAPTAHGVIVGAGAAAPTVATTGTSGQALVDQGSGNDPLFKPFSGDATLAASGAVSVSKTGGVAFAASATTDTTNAGNISAGTLALARGGSGQATAAAARASSGFNIDEATTHGDSNYTILSTDRTVLTSASLTAPRTWTLPAANSVNPGQELDIRDAAGGVSGTNTLTLARAGSDTINGSNSAVISAQYDGRILKSDGVSTWHFIPGGSGGGSGTVTSATISAGNGIAVSGTCTITTSGTCKVSSSDLAPAKFAASVSASNATTTGTIGASSASLSLASAIDFANGQGIRVNHAGASFTASAPTSLTVTPTGTAGSTTYTYTIACLDGTSNNAVKGGVGAALTPVATTTGNASPSPANYNLLNWTAGTGCAGYAIYRNIAGTETLIGFTANHTWNDYGAAAISAPDWVPATAPGSSLPDWLLTTISSGGGTTTLTLAATATNAVSTIPIEHSDTAALNSWASSSCPAVGCYFSPGAYVIESPVLFSTSTKIYGAGRSLATVVDVNPLGDAVQVVLGGTQHPDIRDFTIQGQGNTNSGYDLFISATSGETFSPVIDHMVFNSGGFGVGFAAVSIFRLTHSDIQGQSGAGIYVSNTNNADSGGSTIAENYISGGFGAIADIQYVSSGALRIENNEILSQFTTQYGVMLSQTASTSTADMFVIGNSIEGEYFAAVYITNGSGAVWSNIVIDSNEWAGQLYGVYSFGQAGGYPTNLNVVGNVAQITATYCVYVQQATNVSVSDNVCQGTSAASSIGIDILSTVTTANIGGNVITAFATPVVNASLTAQVKQTTGAIELTNTKTIAASGAQTVDLFSVTEATAFVSGARCDLVVTGNITSVGGSAATASFLTQQSNTAGSTPSVATVTANVQAPTGASNFVWVNSASANTVKFSVTVTPAGVNSGLVAHAKCQGNSYTLTAL